MVNNVKSAKRSLKNFGYNLWKLRTDKGLTHEDLSDLIGTSTRIIYDYESGKKHPSTETVLVIAEKLDVSLDSMFM